MNKYASIFLTFFKIGLTTFGGGYAMISMMHEEIVERQKWITDDELMEVTAIAESTPGPVAINLATYIGYKIGGLKGAILGTISISIPSLLIIFFISLFLNQFLENVFVAKAFMGIKYAVSFLIIDSGIRLFMKSPKSLFNMGIILVIICLMVLMDIFAFSFSTIFLILIGGLLGLIMLTKKGEMI